MTVGRLLVQKGHQHLIAAVPELAARFPHLAVVVVGDGALRDRLAQQVHELGVTEHVHLLGFRPDARMLLDAADVFVLPSRQEAMPLAALEAMDVALPVVATRVFGSAEVVVDGHTGLLVPRDDPRALRDALAALLAEPDRRRAYGRAGQRRFADRYTSARMAAQTMEVYAEVLADGEPRERGLHRRAAGASG